LPVQICVSFLKNLPFSIIATKVFETGKNGTTKPEPPVAQKIVITPQWKE